MRILTFDIEDWFHILDHAKTASPTTWDKFEPRIRQNMEKIFRLIDDTNSKATFFCMGWVAEKYPDVIRDIDQAGFEIGSHSNFHQLAYQQTPEEFRNDLKTSICNIEDLISKKVRAYRAPGFSITENNKWAFDVLIEEGIEIDCSIFPAKRNHGGFSGYNGQGPGMLATKSGMLKEFPINIKYLTPSNPYVFSGGGYFRALPYQFLRRAFGSNDYIMTYFHPRDFDPDQPIIPGLSLKRRFTSYYGLKNCLSKLKSILEEFDFIDLEEANQMVEWSNIPIQNIN